MMQLFTRATNENFDISVKECKFILEDRDHTNKLGCNTFSISPIYSNENYEVLYDLESLISKKETQRAENERKAAIRKSALSKLTHEELAVLGIDSFGRIIKQI